jgi:hypothetical protein
MRNYAIDSWRLFKKFWSSSIFTFSYRIYFLFGNLKNKRIAREDIASAVAIRPYWLTLLLLFSLSTKNIPKNENAYKTESRFGWSLIISLIIWYTANLYMILHSLLKSELSSGKKTICIVNRQVRKEEISSRRFL